MGTHPSPSLKFVFGPFEYDGISGDLHKHGSRIRLQGQPLRILSILVERHGQVVSREDLQQHLWPGATFVDFEQGLNAAVNKLRQTLGDSADQPRYIETLPSRGYRFIAPVQQVPARPVLQFAAPAAVRAETPPRGRSKRWLLLAAGAALAVAGIAGYHLGARNSEKAPLPKVAQFTVVPPAGFELEGAASRQSFALSPDGSQLAFTAMDAGGAFSVFLRDFTSLESRLVPESEGAHTLFWPPDGKSLFLTVRGKLRRFPLGGDVHFALGDSPAFLFSGASLSRDRLLLGSRFTTYEIPASGGTPEPIEASYHWPQALPDGKHLLHTVWDEQAGRHRARVTRLDASAPAKDLVESDSRVLYTASVVNPGSGYLVYIRGGSLLAQPFDPAALRVRGEALPIAGKVYSFFPTGAADFSVSDRGVVAYQSYVSRSQLAWVDREGRQLGTIGPANVNVKSGRLSPDGRMLATAIYDLERGGQSLWLFDTNTGTGRLLTADPGLRDAPVWSPDSTGLAFLRAYPSPPRVAFRGIGEKDQEEALRPGDFQLPTDWSPDGRFVTFMNTGFPRFANETQSDVWLVDLADDRKLLPLLDTRFHEANAAFSPDGKWLAFTSNESGQSEVYVQAFRVDPPSVVGERHLVSRSGALALRWRRDGKELFYLAFDGRVHAVPVKLSPKPEFGPATPLFTISTEARSAVHSIAGFDVSADGQRFVIPVVAPTEGPSIVVIQNWEAALHSH
jgi:DNA-binding winged helix-turn-helix (wHTH) protein